MNPKERFCCLSLVILILATLFAGVPLPNAARAGVNDILLGARDSIDPLDPSSVTPQNFGDYFIYNGTDTPSFTISGTSGGAMIGAIWTGGSPGDWREIRIVIDSNGDGSFDPLDWDDPTHPWNMTSGQWVYPVDYPGIPYDNGPEGSPTTNDGVIDFDAGESFPWDNFLWWWYEADYDRTESWWMEQSTLMNVSWEGRDHEWNMLPNGDYKVQAWVDENNDGSFAGTEANKTMTITVQTANITGTVRDSQDNPIMGAEVEAGSYLAWGQARTGTDGTFTVSGLEAGTIYHISVRTPGKVTAEKDVDLPSAATTADAGTITMYDAVSITGILKLDIDADGFTDEVEDQFQPFINQWGWMQNDLPVWLDAWNQQGPGWGNGEAVFYAGDSSKSFTVDIPPPSSPTTYQISIHVEGYAASPVAIPVDSNGGDAGTIVLTKASILTGSVLLPAAITEWKNIDVQAINVTDSEDRYWGWGNIDPSQGPTDTGTFQIDGVPVGTFDLEIRVWGYAVSILEDVIIVQGQDKDVGQIAVSEGSKITGILTVQGDTTNLMRWEGDTEDPMNVWIDAWSPSAGWGGTNVQVPRGLNQSVGYTIGGLADGTYEVHSWIGEGYELVDDNGNVPVIVSVIDTANQDVVLKPNEGIVQGTITGPGTLDLNKVVVEVKRPWDWLPPKLATVANGGIQTAGATFAVNGFGTGDYIVKAGMYDGFIDFDGNPRPLSEYQGAGWLVPNGAVGISMQRVFVENNATRPTTCNINFQAGYAIAGTLSLSVTDPPWHDINGNGVKDVDLDPALSEVVNLGEDIEGEPVMAMPMEMMFMGGGDPIMGNVNPDGTYQIVGLGPGVYIVMPPFNSSRISALAGGGDPQGDYFEGDQEIHHWTATPQMIVVADSDITGVDFNLANGHTITGRLTLPEAPTGDDWMWVGHLELETPQSGYHGHGRPVFKGDFNNSNRYDFTFHHVENGEYLVRFWTDRYVPGGANVTVNNANASVNLTIERGANLVGKLVDADTGEAITANDGVTVICEAFPWVEGSWRETRNDMWSQSYIEDGSDPQNQERPNGTPGKFHLTALPTGHKYVIFIETFNGQKTGGAKNYVGKVIAGIDIPEGATGNIDVGTIKLKEGTTIQGRITDSTGNPIPGIEVFAFPSDSHDGAGEAEGISDTQGYYTVYGVDPEVDYYDMIAAERPFLFDDWGKEIEWGEKRKYNIAPGSIDIDFVLGQATAILSGNVTIPDDGKAPDDPDKLRFMLPFKGEGEEFPASYIIMQKKGVVYQDVLEGIEGMTAPMPSTATQAPYTINHIEPGKYRIFFMNYGLPTKVFDNVTISEGSNTLDVTWDSTGYKVSGSLALPTGGYPSSSDISGVVCMNASDQTLIFGQLTEEADGTFSAYEVPGLADGETYQLVFYKDTGLDDMPDVFPVGNPFTVSGADITDNTATITRNAEPILMVQAVQDLDDESIFYINIFSTTYLVDASIEVVGVEPTQQTTSGSIYIKTGNGGLSGVILSGDKRNISATYTKDINDSNVDLMLAVHYGDDAATKLATLSFNVNSLATNGDVINTYTAGQVKLGNGDGSQIYIPAGALDASGEGNLQVNIEKSDMEPGTLQGNSTSKIASMGVFAGSAVTALPNGVTAVGNLYDFTITDLGTGGQPTFNGIVTVQIQYDPALLADPNDTSLLNIYHYINSTWVLEATNRTVDEENNTISVEVTSLSPFVPAESPPSSSTPVPGGGGSGGGCFIKTAISGSH